MALPPRIRIPRSLVAIAALSFAGVVLAYAVAPTDRWVRAWVADLSWTWAACFATVCCAYAATRMREPSERAAWYWLTAGSFAFLLAQLVWNQSELIRQVRPPYPSLADIGYLAMYPCVMLAVVQLWKVHPRRGTDLEISIDTILVTFTLGALAQEFLIQPIVHGAGTTLQMLTSIAWSLGGIAVVWMILMQMLYRARFPRGSAGLVLLAIVLHSVTNAYYAVAALDGTYASGGALDLGWSAGLLLLAGAGALAPERARRAEATPAGTALAPRVIALTIGLLGMTVIAAWGAVQRERRLDVALLAIIGMGVIMARVIYSLRADRRYATVLEHEVAAQTRSLMDSLAATAAAERNLRLVMEAVPDAIMLLDREGKTIDVNAAAADMVALPPGAAPGRSLFDFLEPEAVRVTTDNLEAAFEGGVRRFEVPFLRADRTRGIAAVLYAPVREGGRVIKVLALARDVTDLRRAEAQLQQAEKLAAMGQLVSGVAHEINNPAAIISGFAQTLMLDDLKPEQREIVKMVYDEATRIGRITQNLLAFARAGGKDRSLVDVNDVVRRTFALRAYHLSTLNIAVTLELDAEEPKVWGNGSELQQMLLNLLINAEQALVTVERPRTLTLRTAGAENDVALACIDNGPGIPPDIRERIFDPFFTTKPEGVGTGLGLSICYGIVRDHGGRLTVESDASAGVVFLATLPRDPRTQPRTASESPDAEPGAPSVGLSILLVDDEAGLRKAVARFLNRRGVRCRAVGDGAEALEVLRAEDFDVIISDVRMPGMSGREFLERLRADRPELVQRVIFSTGDTFAAETSALLKASGLPSLEKPFDFDRLEALAREVAARISA